jgi:hypothetical protein
MILRQFSVFGVIKQPIFETVAVVCMRVDADRTIYVREVSRTALGIW